MPDGADGAVEALIYIDPACSQQLCLTYAVLLQQQDAVARALLEQGVGPGALVADFCDDGPGLVLAILGVLSAGATVVPLDPTQPRARGRRRRRFTTRGGRFLKRNSRYHG